MGIYYIMGSPHSPLEAHLGVGQLSDSSWSLRPLGLLYLWLLRALPTWYQSYAFNATNHVKRIVFNYQVFSYDNWYTEDYYDLQLSKSTGKYDVAYSHTKVNPSWTILDICDFLGLQMSPPSVIRARVHSSWFPHELGVVTPTPILKEKEVKGQAHQPLSFKTSKLR